MPNSGPNPGDYDDLDAFDAFDGDDSYRNTAQESDALDLFDTEDVGADQSFADQAALDAVDDDFESDDELATNDTDAALESIDSATETLDEDEEDDQDEDGAQLFSVVNPFNTVKVSAHIDGSTFQVKLAPKALNQNDSELADEIIALAALAQQKGRAGQHQYLFDNADQIQGLDALSAFGMDSKQVLKAVTETGMQLPTPEKAAAAQAEIFASRYQKAPLTD